MYAHRILLITNNAISDALKNLVLNIILLVVYNEKKCSIQYCEHLKI